MTLKQKADGRKRRAARDQGHHKDGKQEAQGRRKGALLREDQRSGSSRKRLFFTS